MNSPLVLTNDFCSVLYNHRTHVDNRLSFWQNRLGRRWEKWRQTWNSFWRSNWVVCGAHHVWQWREEWRGVQRDLPSNQLRHLYCHQNRRKMSSSPVTNWPIVFLTRSQTIRPFHSLSFSDSLYFLPMSHLTCPCLLKSCFWIDNTDGKTNSAHTIHTRNLSVRIKNEGLAWRKETVSQAVNRTNRENPSIAEMEHHSSRCSFAFNVIPISFYNAYMTVWEE